MANRKTLPSIRISEDTYEKMARAIIKFNESSLIPMTEQAFRRLAYEILAQTIISGQHIDYKIIQS